LPLQAGDSAGQKLGGALLNAVIFVAIVAGMTFVLFLLFKYKVRQASGVGMKQQLAAYAGYLCIGACPGDSSSSSSTCLPAGTPQQTPMTNPTALPD
jgi:hypothetical protein